jgi:hypothetical protein
MMLSPSLLSPSSLLSTSTFSALGFCRSLVGVVLARFTLFGYL